jgi:hypothetical protein
MATASVLDRRLAAYSATAGIAIAGAASASAAIVYTDIPDATYFYRDGGPQGMNVDLNLDGTADFGLLFDGSTNTAMSLTSANVIIQTVGNPGFWLIDGYYNGPRALNSNVTISLGASRAWYQGSGTLQQFRLGGVGSQAGQAWSVGNFLGRNQKMIGLRFDISGSYHYGWVRVSVAKDARSFTVHDYAYNDMPGEGLGTGVHLPTQLQGTVGSRVNLSAGVVPGSGGTFATAPKVVGSYFDPVKGKKTAKATFKATRNFDGSIAILDLKKKVRLSSAKDFKSGYKFGILCRTFLGRTTPNQGMNFDLDVTLPNKTVVPDVAHLALRPPEITGTAGMPVPGAQVTLGGDWFGVKPPKIWIEYRVLVNGNIQVKAVKLKVLKPYAYPDAKGKLFASCMNVETGASQLTVQLPDAWPDDFDAVSIEHDLVMDNGVGLAYVYLIGP